MQLPSAGANLADVYVQPFLNNCSGTGDTYDGSSGLNWINVYGQQTPSNGQAPLITTGGVFLTGCISNTGAYNQYFTSTACQAGITANVAFAPNVPVANQQVKAIDSFDGTSYTLTPRVRDDVAHRQWSNRGPGGWTARVRHQGDADRGVGAQRELRAGAGQSQTMHDRPRYPPAGLRRL